MHTVCLLSKKLLPISYSKLNKMGNYFLDIKYMRKNNLTYQTGIPSWNLPVDRMKELAKVTRLVLALSSVQISQTLLDRISSKVSHFR